MSLNALPIDEFLPRATGALLDRKVLLLSAEPGAGKTTRFPQALVQKITGRILLVVPRRLAAKSAAARIAVESGSTLGAFAGYAVRGESRYSAETRILAVTSGVYLEMLKNDPGLDGIYAVIFDEFHERSWQSDLALTLTMEVKETLREDLLLTVMSATLETGELIRILPKAAEIQIPGRTFPVEIIHTPAPPGTLPQSTCRMIQKICTGYEGNLLVFLPGVPEINRTAELLAKWGSQQNPPLKILILHGQLPLKEQDLALKEYPGYRKVILSTNVAESSITVKDISLVLDTGWEKNLMHHPGRGMDELKLMRISLSSARQRSGRAGRTAPGTAFRMWSLEDERQLFPANHTPEILNCELSPLLLTLLQWGTPAEKLSWVSTPPESALQVAKQLLSVLGAVDTNGRLTSFGKKLATLPVHPRPGAILCAAHPEHAAAACDFAALLEETRTGDKEDVFRLFEEFRCHRERFKRSAELSERLKKQLRATDKRCSTCDLAELAAPGFADRAAVKISGGRYRLANGIEAQLPEDSSLYGFEGLIVLELSSASGTVPIIRCAASSTKEKLREIFADQLVWRKTTGFNPDKKQIFCRRELRLGSITFESANAVADAEDALPVLLNETAKRQLQLPPENQKAAILLKAKTAYAVSCGEPDLPDWDDPAVWQAFLEENISLYHPDCRSFADLEKIPYFELISNVLGINQVRELNRLYPDNFISPGGRKHPIDYHGEQPTVSLRLQELYGVDVHPTVGSRKIPLRLELLSPAMRPVQISCDLPGFWRSSWETVRKEMRGRYPKHNWPEHPENEPAQIPKTKINQKNT